MEWNNFFGGYECGCGQKFQVLIYTGDFYEEEYNGEIITREVIIFDEENTCKCYLEHDCKLDSPNKEK